MHRTALLALVLLASGPARAQDASPDPAAISSSIARGAAWLRAQQQKDGTFACQEDLQSAGETKMGINALAVLALARCGPPPPAHPTHTTTHSTHPAPHPTHPTRPTRPTHPTHPTEQPNAHPMAHDPALRHAVEALEHPVTPTVYTEALLLQALEAAGASSEAARKRAHVAGEFLVAAQSSGGAWSYRQSYDQAFDNSNTQFALLGLRACHRLLGDPRPEVWVRAGDHLLATQQQDGPAVDPFEVPAAEQALTTRARHHGATASTTRMKSRGWTYTTAATPEEGTQCTVSMTASGVTGLVLVKAHLEGTPWWTKHGPAVDAGIRDGMAWLRTNWTVELPSLSTYGLYSMERAGAVCGVDELGPTAWYPQGTARLLAKQAADGSWEGEWGVRTVGTCFALLYLTKATPPAGATVLRQQRTATEAPKSAR